MRKRVGGEVKSEPGQRLRLGIQKREPKGAITIGSKRRGSGGPNKGTKADRGTEKKFEGSKSIMSDVVC